MAPFGLVNSTVTSGGVLIVGGVVSKGLTVTWNSADTAWPHMSVVVHVTVVVPIGKVAPESFEHERKTIFRNAPPETPYLPAAPLDLVAFTVMSSGTRTNGSVTGVTARLMGTGPVWT